MTETVISYDVDFADRLLGVTKAVTVTLDGNVRTSQEEVRYSYDGLGREVGKQTDVSALSYVYGGGRLIEVRGESGETLVTTLLGLATDRGGTRYYFQADGLGTVRALADDAGGVLRRMGYDPFGAPLYTEGESAVDAIFVYHGRRYDPASGLYLHGPDRYDPSTGRYLQRDRQILGNGYTFAANNPGRGVPR